MKKGKSLFVMNTVKCTVITPRNAIQKKMMMMNKHEIYALILAQCQKPDHAIRACLDTDETCLCCADALQQNGNREENKCVKCVLPPFICNHGDSSLMHHCRKYNNYGELMPTPKYTLFKWTFQQLVAGECSCHQYVQKAEELGLGELVAYWKIQLLDEKIEKIKDKLNELINKVNISKL